MSIIYFLLPLALILLIGTIIGFFWAVKNEQFDDLDGPPLKILIDDNKNNNQ